MQTKNNIPVESDYKKNLANHFSKKKKYWNVIYDPDHKEGDQFMNDHIRTRKETVLQLIDEQTNGTELNILDVGCGTGVLMKDILERRHNVIGTDISEQMLLETKETLKDYSSTSANALSSDVEKLPFKDNVFDVVTCIGVLEYLYDENLGVCEITRVVKPGGFVIMSLPNMLKIKNLLDPYFYLNRGLKYLLQKFRFKNNGKSNSLKDDDFSTNRIFSNKRYLRSQVKYLFKNNNFREIANVSLGFGPLTFWKKKLLPHTLSIKISNYLENLSRKRIFSFMNNLPNRWVICQQKLNN